MICICIVNVSAAQCEGLLIVKNYGLVNFRIFILWSKDWWYVIPCYWSASSSNSGIRVLPLADSAHVYTRISRAQVHGRKIPKTGIGALTCRFFSLWSIGYKKRIIRSIKARFIHLLSLIGHLDRCQYDFRVNLRSFLSCIRFSNILEILLTLYIVLLAITLTSLLLVTWLLNKPPKALAWLSLFWEHLLSMALLAKFGLLPALGLLQFIKDWQLRESHRVCPHY